MDNRWNIHRNTCKRFNVGEQMKIDMKTIKTLLISFVIGAFGWVFNSIEEIKSHQNACDSMVIELNSELDMLESNFNQLLFKLQG